MKNALKLYFMNTTFGHYTYTAGPKFPDPEGVLGAGHLPFEDSFLVIGGATDDGVSYSDNIYKYNPAEEAWELREETLRSEKDHFGYIFVNREAIDC